METPPIHVLLALDAQILGGEAGAESSTGDEGSTTPDASGRTATSSRFWGVTWHRKNKKWKAHYQDASGKTRHIGYFDDEEEAARAVNKAISDAGLESRRKTNAVDATGALVPRRWGGSSAVVAPDPSRAPTATTSKYWGVTWAKRQRRWQVQYTDANGKKRFLGLYYTQEAAAHAFNAAIRALPPDVQLRRKTNPVVDGQLVPRETYKRGLRGGKRRRENPAATTTPSTRPRHA